MLDEVLVILGLLLLVNEARVVSVVRDGQVGTSLRVLDRNDGAIGVLLDLQLLELLVPDRHEVAIDEANDDLLAVRAEIDAGGLRAQVLRYQRDLLVEVPQHHSLIVAD